MNETSNIVPLRQPGEIDDPRINILRAGARQLLAQAVEVEVETFLAGRCARRSRDCDILRPRIERHNFLPEAMVKDLKLADGRARVVRQGYGPARTIQTGVGAVEVAPAKIRDRGAPSDGERIEFSSVILLLWRCGPEVWMRCCRCSTCAAFRPAISSWPSPHQESASDIKAQTSCRSSLQVPRTGNDFAKRDRCWPVGTRFDHVQRVHPFGMPVGPRQAGIDQQAAAYNLVRLPKVPGFAKAFAGRASSNRTTGTATSSTSSRRISPLRASPTVKLPSVR